MGLLIGVITTIYYQYFSATSIFDFHPGLIGLSVNVAVVLVGTFVFKQSIKEEKRAVEFINI